PQSALVILEGSDADTLADALTYRIVTSPANGNLSDPDNGGAAVSTGTIAGQGVTYTPDTGFTGTDTFTYLVNDGSANSEVRTAFVSVFDVYRDSAKQIGVDIDGEAFGDESGYSVALSSDGQTVAIGAIRNNGAGVFSGHVRIYRWNGSAWVQRGSDIDGETGDDQSGWSVSLSSDGQTVAIGANVNSGAGVFSGHVRIYRWNGSAWVQRGGDIDGEAAGDQSGYAVALSSDGQTVAIGAPFNDGAGSFSGHVRIYRWNGSAWVQRGSDIDGEAADDQSGISVALSSDGETVAIGAIGNDGAAFVAGHVRIYRWNGNAWVQRGIDIDGEAADDFSGISVALSSDGQTVAIGARFNDGAGSFSGHVRIYRWNGSAWVQQGSDIDGEAADDQSGYAVALSSDGQTVAIGALFNDGKAFGAGHVRVFNLVNVRPRISNMPPTSVGDALNFSFQMQAIDTDPGEVLTWSLSNHPGWLSLDPDTGLLEGTPENNDSGTNTDIVLMVSDAAAAEDTVVFDLTVPDSDGDGLIDGRDDCDGTPGSETGAINADGCGPSERDTDGDGANDAVDAFPNDPNEQLDSDGDGFGDNREADAGSDPNDAGDIPAAPGLPVWLIYGAVK
ncbi:MAG: putative Ig domain-containing protein, partial [Congregibacter sp.]